MDIISKQLREARDLFEAMLQRKTREAEWQAFFAAHPYALTPSLPLRLEPRDIIPLGRPGKTEPDLIFYSDENPTLPVYGVIELKRPDQRIARITRANVGQLTAPALTAVVQSKQYIETVPDLANKQLSGRNLFLGNNQYLFVIMGLSDELIFQPGQEMFWKMIRHELPGNLQFLPYDIVFRNFPESLYRQIHILVPKRPAVEEAMSLMEPEKKKGSFYIDPVFDAKPWQIWTADKSISAGSAWVVDFYVGYCGDYRVYSHSDVRAVRS